ncbi:MBL fold metallo-hydrolase [Kordiimonas gwangyangensis]|uniref:MBL fold metallo-hydrolase n=2 Tax=Kordiimonas gwangyangensis TaxID=288022 RepID=UPI0003752BA3|nr:MBL fold metallo-hydrolase [Kordiimonas gwangyangensis]
MKSFISGLAVSVLLGSAALAEEGGISRIRVTETVHVLDGSGGYGANVGVLEYEGGVALIDTMLPAHATSLKAAVRQITDKPVTYIFNTHDHSDHMGSNDVFTADGATAIQVEGTSENDEVADFSATYGSAEVRIYAVVSHTKADRLVFLPGPNVLFMGDTFTTDWHPTFYAGGAEGQLATIAAALEIADDDTVIVPGHGPLSDRQGLMVYQKAFKDWIDRMAALDAGSKSTDQLRADAGLRSIAARFMQGQRPAELPEQAYRRFIERTVTVEFSK